MISAGHRYSDIMDVYTVEQVLLYYRATLRCRVRWQKELAGCIRTANNAKKQSYQKYMKALEAFPRKLDTSCGIVHSVPIDQLFAQVQEGLNIKRKRPKRGDDRRAVDHAEGR